MPRLCIALLLAALGATVPAVRADVWDQGNDNDLGTDTELTHGLVQVHDLAAQAGGTVQDEDWYRLQIPEKTSWEVVLDGMTGGRAGRRMVLNRSSTDRFVWDPVDADTVRYYEEQSSDAGNTWTVSLDSRYMRR